MKGFLLSKQKSLEWLLHILNYYHYLKNMREGIAIMKSPQTFMIIE